MKIQESSLYSSAPLGQAATFLVMPPSSVTLEVLHVSECVLVNDVLIVSHSVVTSSFQPLALELSLTLLIKMLATHTLPLMYCISHPVSVY